VSVGEVGPRAEGSRRWRLGGSARDRQRMVVRMPSLSKVLDVLLFGEALPVESSSKEESAMPAIGSQSGGAGFCRSASEKKVDQRPCELNMTRFSPPRLFGLEFGVEGDPIRFTSSA
jgi:hypothetical protein